MDSDLMTKPKSVTNQTLNQTVRTESERTEDSEKSSGEIDSERIVEVSPNNHYARFNTILGKGAFKVVWKAIDNEEGYEVAWNTFQVSFFIYSRPPKLKL